MQPDEHREMALQKLNPKMADRQAPRQWPVIHCFNATELSGAETVPHDCARAAPGRCPAGSAA